MTLRRVAAPRGDLLLRGAPCEAGEELRGIDVDEGRRGDVRPDRLLQLFALITRQIRQKRLERREHELLLRDEHARLRPREERREALHDLVDAVRLPTVTKRGDLFRARRSRGGRREELAHVERDGRAPRSLRGEKGLDPRRR